MEDIEKSAKITILIAEDEEPLRDLFTKILDSRKDRFNTLIAVDGKDAFDIAARYEGDIHLLVSNVQMPGITGPDLAAALKQSRPNMRVMLMSGYPQGILLLDHTWHFLQKPFMPKAVIDKIESILAQPVSDETHSSGLVDPVTKGPKN